MSVHDVVVIGEVLLEVSSLEPFAAGGTAHIGVSGDALNTAAAAAAAGARVGLLAILPPNGLGDAIQDRVQQLGVDTTLLRRRPGNQGVYLVHSDPQGQREFMYARQHSVGSTLAPQDLDDAQLTSAGATLTSGITAAISDSARATVIEASRTARRFAYDPNFRPALTTRPAAAAVLNTIVPRAWLVAPSHPTDVALSNLDNPRSAIAHLLAAGAQHVAITCGSDGALIGDAAGIDQIPPYPARTLIDQTGAGDSFMGSLVARLVLGERFVDAAHYAAAAAALSVAGRGGTGFVANESQVLDHVQTFANTR